MASGLTLRPYQQECVNKINQMESGSGLIALPVGTGKTVVFSNIERKGRVLILSHREELVHQPEKYYDCSYGVERAEETSHGEDVISASVQTLIRRLDKFSPDTFDTIITDEAHHAVAPSYRKIYDHFRPRIHIGFTATPNRHDRIGLGKIYDRILYEKDLRWGIENGYLSDINCQQVELNFNLKKVKRQMGDFQDGSLADVMDRERNNVGIAKAYKELAVGPTVIFAVNVSHVKHLTEEINKICGREEAVAITASTENRSEILDRFRKGEIHCLVNCMVLTEGTDLPMIRTIIMARPTQNESLLMQCVGRGTRKYPRKKELLLIDCVGSADGIRVCSPASLIGADDSALTKDQKKKLKGSILAIADTIARFDEEAQEIQTSADQWQVMTRTINLFAEELHLDMRNINFTVRADGGLCCSLGKNKGYFYISPMNYLGRNILYFCDPSGKVSQCTREASFQQTIDNTRWLLDKYFQKNRALWDMDHVRKWGVDSLSPAQKNFIIKLLSYPVNKGKYTLQEIEKLTKYEASRTIDLLLEATGPIKRKKKKGGKKHH